MHPREIVILFLILGVSGLVLCFTSDELRVTLTNGSKLVGRYLRSYSGRPIKAFTAIPYAKPPIGNLRFKNPEPLEKWDGEYKAINNGPICSQRNPFIRSFTDAGSEDCLHLNVYAPHKFEEKVLNLPVIVYIPGGGFMCGSASLEAARPDYILDKDVIFVTANYRVGPLGFLSTEDENCPGNFGLKDQVMVLKWVHENIKQFGGDPNSVTIFGGSSGGASVTYLMASPLAKGLVFKGIASSGTNLAPWSQPAHEGVARKRAKQLAEKFNCYVSNDWSQTIDCLRNVPAINITAAFYDFFKFDNDPKVPFPPVVEPELPGAFMTKHPRDEIPGDSLKIPFLTGINFDEGLLKTAFYFNNPHLFDEFITHVDYVLPIALYYDHHDVSTQASITNKIKEFYFDNNLTKDKELNVTNLFGDVGFMTAMDSYLRLRLAHEKAAPTYVYLLTPKVSVSVTALLGGDPDKIYGVSHADDGIYVFPTRERAFPNTLPTKEDEQMQKTMIQIITDFARTGNPTPDSSDLPKWNVAKRFPLNYYRIGNLNFEHKPIVGMEDGGLFENRANFWRKIRAHLPAKHLAKDEL